MAYERTVWENNRTPINAANLNNMEEGILKAQNFIGENLIAAIEEDTPANWAAVGTGVVYINGSGILKNQPESRGYMETRTNGSTVSQTFWGRTTDSMNTPKCYQRFGNSDGWYNDENWVEIVDNLRIASHIKSYIDGNMNDYMAEIGTGSVWSYIKFASGRYEAWKKVTSVKPSSMTAAGNNYYGTINLGDVPSWSTGIFVVNISLFASQYAWVSREYIEDNVIKAAILRSTSSAPTVSAYVTLKGTYN